MWVVGNTPLPAESGGEWAYGNDPAALLMLHGSGSALTRVASPPVDQISSYEITGPVSRDVAVGPDGRPWVRIWVSQGFYPGYATAVYRWDGTAWKGVGPAEPTFGFPTTIDDLVVPGPNNARAVGVARLVQPVSVVWHWDGTAWQSQEVDTTGEIALRWRAIAESARPEKLPP